jgi:hypothetical protein
LPKRPQATASADRIAWYDQDRNRVVVEGLGGPAFALADEKSVTSIYESPTAKQLYALMSGEDNDQWFLERDIDRWEIIGNLKDWVALDEFSRSLAEELHAP